jgi:hypothetical protein
MSERTKHIIRQLTFTLVLLTLLVPLVQTFYPFTEVKPLYGGFPKKDRPSAREISWGRWFQGTFQDNFTQAVRENIGFKEFYIRLSNQLNFSLYRVSENPNIVIGTDDCLFEEGYILAYLGHNFIGKRIINERLRRAKWVQDYFRNEKGIDILIVFAPGKGSYHAANIPERYRPWDKKLSNYDYFVSRCKETGIRYVDLNAVFAQARDTSKYILIPRYGVHWGTYGMTLGADTLMRYIEQLRGIDMPDFDWSEIEVTDQRKDVDIEWDAEQTLNLLSRLPYEQMAYPKIQWAGDSTKYRPRVLTIADSYYWNLYNSGIPQHCFRDHQFWYYYYQVYPHIWDDSHLVGKLNVRDTIEKQEVILLMSTEMNLYRAFWQFTDDLYRWYCPDYRPDPRYDAMNAVIDNDYWLRETIALARSKGITVAQAIQLQSGAYR